MLPTFGRVKVNMLLFVVWDIVQFEEKNFGMNADKKLLLEDRCLTFAAKSPGRIETKKPD